MHDGRLLPLIAPPASQDCLFCLIFQASLRQRAPQRLHGVTVAWLLLRCDGLEVNEENEGRREVAVEEEEEAQARPGCLESTFSAFRRVGASCMHSFCPGDPELGGRRCRVDVGSSTQRLSVAVT